MASSSSSGAVQRPRAISNVASAPILQTTSNTVVETSNIREGRNEAGERMINQYLLVSILGKGQHGEVHFATNTVTGEQVVCLREFLHDSRFAQCAASGDQGYEA